MTWQKQKTETLQKFQLVYQSMNLRDSKIKLKENKQTTNKQKTPKKPPKYKYMCSIHVMYN